jgi:hypothetical protein
VTKTWGNFTSLNYWVVRDYYRLVQFVNSFEPKIQKLSDDQVLVFKFKVCFFFNNLFIYLLYRVC